MESYRPLEDEEKVALWLLATGDTKKEIAGKLGISPKMVENRLNKVFEKIHAQNQKDAISRAISHNIVPVEKLRDYFGISPDEVTERSTSQATESGLEDSLHIKPPRLPDVPSSFQYYPADTHAFDADLTQAWKQFGYLPTVAMEYERKLAAIYQFDDDRILYKKELGVHTLPYRLYEPVPKLLERI
jgi:DNA-binding CsgD family transcriptional regulator